MKITRVESIPFSIPYLKPLHFASGEVHAAEHVLVRVHTDDGVIGNDTLSRTLHPDADRWADRVALAATARVGVTR